MQKLLILVYYFPNNCLDLLLFQPLLQNEWLVSTVMTATMITHAGSNNSYLKKNNWNSYHLLTCEELTYRFYSSLRCKIWQILLDEDKSLVLFVLLLLSADLVLWVLETEVDKWWHFTFKLLFKWTQTEFHFQTYLYHLSQREIMKLHNHNLLFVFQTGPIMDISKYMYHIYSSLAYLCCLLFRWSFKQHITSFVIVIDKWYFLWVSRMTDKMQINAMLYGIVTSCDIYRTRCSLHCWDPLSPFTS